MNNRLLQALNKTSKLALGLAGCAAATVIAYAAVTFDPSTGTGFVGKGDVQLALGLNNPQLQALAAQPQNIVFLYSDVVEYDVPCMKENSAQVLRKSFNRDRGINAKIAYDARKVNQISGFILTGFDGDPIVSGDEIACPGGWNADGNPVLVSVSGGGLSVNGVPLTVTPEPVL